MWAVLRGLDSDKGVERLQKRAGLRHDQSMSDKTARESSEAFLNAVLDSPWGSMSKAELEFLVFDLLIKQGRVDLKKSDTALSTQLRTTPTRVRGLRFKYQQRTGVTLDASALLGSMQAFNAEHDDRVLVTIDSVYLLGLLVDELRSRHYLVQRELTGGMIRVSLLDLVETLGDMGVLQEVKADVLLGRLNKIRKKQRLKDKKRTLAVRGGHRKCRPGVRGRY